MLITGKVGKERSQWMVLEGDDFIHVMPVTDILPHGKKITNREYYLTADCPCKPRVEQGEVRDGRFFKFDKPIVTHNSFEDNERIDAVIAKFIK